MNMHTVRAGMLLCGALFTSSGRTATTQSAQRELRWEVLQKFGEAEPPPNSQFGGSAFARISSVRPLKDGRVAVLDLSYKKVALFAKDGKFVRTIGRGIGRGPGEFQRPIGLDVDEGRIAVFDYDGNRVTVFDTLGNVLWTRITPRARQIILVGDTIYGSYMPGKQYMVWRQPTDAFESVERLVPVNPRILKEQHPDGGVAMLGRSENAKILVSHVRPGFWYELLSSTVSDIKGKDLVENAVFRLYDDIVVPPGEPWGIFPLSERYLGIAFTTFNHSAAKPEIASRELAVFDRNTQSLVGRIDIGGGELALPVIGPGLGKFEVLIARTEPFPHVVRMVLRGLQ